MLSALADHEVRFVLIGGMAAVLHGDVGVTVDVDVVPDRAPDNLERLASALRELAARIRTEGEPEGLRFDCSAAFFANLSPDKIVNTTTSAGELDITFCPSDLLRRRLRYASTRLGRRTDAGVGWVSERRELGSELGEAGPRLGLLGLEGFEPGLLPSDRLAELLAPQRLLRMRCLLGRRGPPLPHGPQPFPAPIAA